MWLSICIKRLVFGDMFYSGVYSAFCIDARKIPSLNVGPTPRFDKIGRMVNSLVSAVYFKANSNANESMSGSTYLRENNYISIWAGWGLIV